MYAVSSKKFPEQHDNGPMYLTFSETITLKIMTKHSKM